LRGEDKDAREKIGFGVALKAVQLFILKNTFAVIWTKFIPLQISEKLAT